MEKKLRIRIPILTALILTPVFAFQHNPPEYIDTNIDWHHVKMVKAYIWNNYKFKVNVVPDWQPARSVRSLMDEYNWIAAINWAFFCPDESAYSRCERWTSDALRVSNHILYSKWWFDMKDTDAVIWYSNWPWMNSITNKTKYRAMQPDWHSERANDKFWVMHDWLGMPALVLDWVSVSHMNNQMNNDAKQWAANTKQFLCSQDTNNILFWSVSSITFRDFWPYLKDSLWCENAILLDWGWSRSMIFNWEDKIWPGRNVMDAIVIVPHHVWDDWANPFTQQEPERTPVPVAPIIRHPFGNIDEPVTDALLIWDHLWLFNTIDAWLQDERPDTRLAIYRNFIWYARNIDQNNVPRSQVESVWRVITLARFMNEVLNSN